VRYTFEEEVIRETQVRVLGLGVDIIHELKGMVDVNVGINLITLDLKLIETHCSTCRGHKRLWLQI